MFIPYKENSFRSFPHGTYPELERLYGDLMKDIENHLIEYVKLYDDEEFDDLREFTENDVDGDDKLYHFISDLGIDIKPDENGITMVELRKILGGVIAAVDDYVVKMFS